MVDQRLQPLADEGLHQMAFHRHGQPRHGAEHRGVARDGQPHLGRHDVAPRGAHALDGAALDDHRGDFAMLNDVHAARIRGMGKAPGHGVMPRRAAAPLQQPAQHRVARIVEVDQRAHGLDLLGPDQLGIDAGQAHGIAAAGEGVALRVAVEQVQDATLAHHHIVAERLLQPFPELQRMLVEMVVLGQQVVGADDGGVAPGIAHADGPTLQHRHLGDAVDGGEVEGRRQPMPAAADHDGVIGGLGLGLAPGGPPAAIAGEPLGQDAKAGIGRHGGEA